MTEVERERYREMAAEIRALLPMLLRLLAARYERLAEHLEAVPDTPHLRRQAG
jgi:hypothetical protein